MCSVNRFIVACACPARMPQWGAEPVGVADNTQDGGEHTTIVEIYDSGLFSKVFNVHIPTWCKRREGGRQRQRMQIELTFILCLIVVLCDAAPGKSFDRPPGKTKTLAGNGHGPLLHAESQQIYNSHRVRSLSIFEFIGCLLVD